MLRNRWTGWGLLVLGCLVMLSCAGRASAPDPEAEARQRELDRKMAAVHEARAEEERRIEAARRRSEEIEAARLAALQRDEELRTQRFLNDAIYFKTGSSRLSPQATALLERKAVWLKEHPEASVVIEGHCDDRGGRLYNLRLGHLRAGRVKSFLVRRGIDAGRLAVVSFGKERPVDAGRSAEAKAKNRRVHLVLDR
jgi:peptidoglycan-associated lipoprotein